MPFHDKLPQAKKRGVKITNEASTVPVPKPNITDAFDKKAKEVFNKHEEYKQRSWDLGTRFKKMMESKILPENKTLIDKDLENEVITGLSTLASEMNQDDNQPEGMGSVALSVLMMKMVILQKDTINTLAYRIETLSKTIQKLEVSLKSSDKDDDNKR